MINNIGSMPAGIAFKQQIQSKGNRQLSPKLTELDDEFKRELGYGMSKAFVLGILAMLILTSPLLLCTRLCQGAVHGTKSVIATVQKLVSKL